MKPYNHNQMNRLFPIWLALACCLAACQPGNRAGSPQDREALYHYIMEKTIERESVSCPKMRVMDYDPFKEMQAYREELIAAATEEALFNVLMKMSNVRRDRHAVVNPVEGGLRVDRETDRRLPLIFEADYGTPGNYFFFIGDIAKNFPDYSGGQIPQTGDKLIAFDGIPVKEYIEILRPYMRYSSYNGLWRQMAEHIPRQHFRLPVPMDRKEISLTLENSSGEVYAVELPLLEADEIVWEGHYKRHGDHRYPGFGKLASTISYDLYLHNELEVLLIDWYGFRPSLIEDVDSLMDYAEKKGFLGHRLIFDGTRSRGGSNGAYLIQRLFGEPFRVTFGNLKISDLTPRFIEDRLQAYHAGQLGGTRDGGSMQIDWLTTDVRDAMEQGRDFTANVPHKLAHLPKDSDGILQPAPLRFTGEVVCLLGPWGGSHLDQFAAMVIDNGLAYTIGMPAGGFSSTWEFGEVLHFPGSDRPLAYFEWGMGNTIRPNMAHPLKVVDKYGRYAGLAMEPDGVVLEGNPPPVDLFIPQTRENYLDYYDMLLEEAFRKLGLRSTAF